MEESDVAEFDWLRSVTTNSGAQGLSIAQKDFPPSVLSNIEKRMSASGSQAPPVPPTAPSPSTPPQQSATPDAQQYLLQQQQQQQFQLMQQLQQQQLLNYQMQVMQQQQQQVPTQNMMMYQQQHGQMMMAPNGQMMMMAQPTAGGHPQMGMFGGQPQLLQPVQTAQGIQWMPMVQQPAYAAPHGAMGHGFAPQQQWAMHQQAMAMQNNKAAPPPPPPMQQAPPPPPFPRQQMQQRPGLMAPPPPPTRQHAVGAAVGHQGAARLPQYTPPAGATDNGRRAGGVTPNAAGGSTETPQTQPLSARQHDTTTPCAEHTVHPPRGATSTSPAPSTHHHGVLSIDSPETRPHAYNVDAVPFVPGLPPSGPPTTAHTGEGSLAGDAPPQVESIASTDGSATDPPRDGVNKEASSVDGERQQCPTDPIDEQHPSVMGEGGRQPAEQPAASDTSPASATLSQGSARGSLTASGICPPMALGGMDDELSVRTAPPPPLQPPPSYGSAASSSVHPSNPTFVIPPRCVGKNADGRTSFKCPYCSDKGFLSEYVLRSHLRAKHVTDASFLVRPSVADAIAPLVMEYLAVDGPVSGGSAPLADVVQSLPLEIAGDIRDATHFEALLGTKDDFVVFQYTADELELHRISSDVATHRELRVALLGAPYVKVDAARSTFD